MGNLDLLYAMLLSSDPAVRHRAALDLMDIGDPASVPFLVEAIEKPENRNHRGTLVYALSAFNCKAILPQLYLWAVESGYEASCAALSIILEQELRPAPSELPAYEAILARLLECGTDQEVAEELRAVLDEAAG